MYYENLKTVVLLLLLNIHLKTFAVCMNKNKAGKDNSKLTGTIIKIIANYGFAICARECEALSSCKAVNYHKFSHLCELLSPPLKGYILDNKWRSAGNMTMLKNYKLSTGFEQEECPAFHRKVELKSGIVHCLKQNFPLDCQDTEFNLQGISNGVYRIAPRKNCVFDVYCDFEVDGDPWTVIQTRVDGNVDFVRNWADYKAGFGDLHRSYWLGNDNIHRLVSDRDYSLRVDMEYFDGKKWYAKYLTFYVAGEDSKYQLEVGGHTGTAGDSLGLHTGRFFSTTDRNNNVGYRDCSTNTGGWWFKSCFTAFLNGIYYNKPILAGSEVDSGIHWLSVKDGYYPLKSVSMKVRKR